MRLHTPASTLTETIISYTEKHTVTWTDTQTERVILVYPPKTFIKRGIIIAEMKGSLMEAKIKMKPV